MQLSRRRLDIRGAVQGVGFRPFVHRLAADLRLAGWVANTPQGVAIEVEGPDTALEAFRRRLEDDRPPLARIAGLESLELDPAGHVGFEIRGSLAGGTATAHVLPDVAACDLCVREAFDPRDRRYRYPFGACTHCGPRYSIVERLPWDRPNTSMQRFLLCAPCRAEYEDPDDRRFHAQAVACPDCGPQLALWAPDGRVLSRRHAALVGSAHALREGAVVAVKGVGGFHLVCNARDEAAVRRLRERKRRAEKPFAVMVASLDEAGRQAELSDVEARLLRSPEAPIVLVRRAVGSTIAASAAPESPMLGLLLPYTPLHHLLARETAVPLVATSGNVADEPLCIDEHEALGRLRGIADLLLVHDRPIVRPVEDSVARVVLGRELVLRRARGYAPLPIPLAADVPCIAALGGPRRNAPAVARGREVVLGPHVGDAGDLTLRTLETLEALAGAAESVACDVETADLAAERGLPVVGVDRARAHVLACAAENGLDGPFLGVAWGGTGDVLSTDGPVARLRDFPLPGGRREPRGAALGLLWERMGPSAFEHVPYSTAEARVLREGLQRGEPRTSSMERLLEAFASLLGLRHRAGFEGQALLDLEHAAGEVVDGPSLPLVNGRLDWAPLVDLVLAGGPPARLAAQIHESLAAALTAVAQSSGLERVALSGSCFQNRRLLERCVLRLRAAGFRPYWPQRIPPNEGGLAVGQVLAVSSSRKA